jgi:hypothetical protein
MPLRTFVIFLALSLVAHAGWLKPDVDFSNYDVPLYEQIVNRIKAKISNRFREGANTRDRYFIIPFAYENDGNDPEFSHSFMSVIRVFADDKQPRLTQGLKLRRYKNREFEAFTISWLPRDFMTNPDLCVLKAGAPAFLPKRTNVLYCLGETFHSKKPSSWPRMKKTPSPCGDPTKSARRGLIWPSSASASSTQEPLSTGQTTASTEKIESPSIAFTPSPV